MIRKFAVKKSKIGNRNVLNEPRKIASPASQISMLRYIGLRLILKGPDVAMVDDFPCSWKLAPILRNIMAATIPKTKPRSISTIPQYV